jgi:DNA-binding NarL/FixJ family response regulator
VRLFREGLAAGLTGRDDVAVVGATDSLDAACAALLNGPPDIVLLDTGMSRVYEFARVLLRVAGAAKIVGVAVADDGADVVACGEAGMAGFVARDGSIDDVVGAIHSVMRDELQCSPRVTAALFRRLVSNGAASSPAQRALPLTPREVEIVGLIDGGLSNKEIAQRLRIGTATVKNHVHNILEKLHVSRRAEAAARVRASQAVRPPFPRRGPGASPLVDASV